MKKLILLLAICSSCTLPPAHITVDFQANEDYRQAAIIATENWNQTCGINLLSIEPNGTVVLTSKKAPEGKRQGTTVFDDHWLRPTTAIAAWFVEDELAVLTITHEFGHVLGLRHQDNGIMHPSAEYYMLNKSKTNIVDGLILPENCARVIELIGNSKDY
jgi:hypothetical protein